MNVYILDIPHIREEVAQYLDQKDLIQCTLVSKRWHLCFTIELWKHPNRNPLENQIFYHRYLPTIIKYKDYIHTIQDHNWGRKVKSSLLRWTFPSLRTFKSGVFSSNQNYLTNSILSFIKKSQMLQSLELELMRYDDYIHRRLVRIFQSHPTLSDFKFTCHMVVPPLQIQELIQACSRFVSVRLEILSSRIANDLNLEKNLIDVSMAKEQIAMMENTNIRKLHITLVWEYEISAIVVPLLEKCPLLERLNLSNYGEKSISEITAVLQKGKCPHLQDISISGSTGKCGMEQLLLSIGFNGEESSTDNESEGRAAGIVSYFQGVSEFSWTPKLTQRHSQTITRFALDGFKLISVVELADIVQNFPNLRSLSTGLWIDGSSLAIEVLKTPWKVRNMTDLKLCFRFHSNFKSVLDPVWKESAIDKYLTWIFSGIGKLDKLKSLELRNSRDLMSILVEPYYLQMLSELKQLRRIGFQCWVPALMSSAEAEWMIDNWPRLIEINVSEEPWRRHARGTMDRNLVEFTTTLKQRRPWLQIIEEE